MIQFFNITSLLSRLLLISSLFCLSACLSKKKKQDSDKTEPLVKRYLREELRMDGLENYNLLVIDNFKCNSCTKSSLEELLSLKDSINQEYETILVLTKLDSSFMNIFIESLEIDQIHYDKSSLEKYGLLKHYPYLIKVRKGKPFVTKRFLGSILTN